MGDKAGAGGWKKKVVEEDGKEASRRGWEIRVVKEDGRGKW